MTTPGAAEAFEALDVADALIERAYGTDVPEEWNAAIRRVQEARTKTQRRRSGTAGQSQEARDA